MPTSTFFFLPTATTILTQPTQPTRINPNPLLDNLPEITDAIPPRLQKRYTNDGWRVVEGGILTIHPTFHRRIKHSQTLQLDKTSIKKSRVDGGTGIRGSNRG